MGTQTSSKMPSTPSLGPALALMEAVRDDRREFIDTIAAELPLSTLVNSTCELIHRMFVHSEITDSIDDLVWLMEITEHRWACYEVCLYHIERYVPFTPAQHYARSFAHAILDHYERAAERDEYPQRFDYPVAGRGPLLTRQFVIGLAYTATILAIELADADEADLDDRIDALRAYAAAVQQNAA